MACIPFTFVEDTHTYQVEGHYVLSTSDVVELAGLCDYSAIPSSILDRASFRGKEVHKSIHYFEDGDLDPKSVSEEVLPYFRGYLKFRHEHDFEPISLESAIVYEHEGSGQMIGCTMDLRGMVDGKLYIVDAKCTHPNAGMAKKQQHLRWRMQLQSYWEATMVDEGFWAKVSGDAPIGKAILHLKKDASYEFINFEIQDEALNWDACVRMAMLRLANGWKRSGK